MSGKPKQPGRQYPGWGGGNRNAGRKPSPYTLRQLTVAVKDEVEWEVLKLLVPDTRQRTEILLEVTKEAGND